MKKTLLLFFLLFAFVSYAQNKVFVHSNASGANNGTSWTNAFVNLQTAINSVGFGDSIFVAKGIYKPVNLPFELKNGVKIYGGFLGTEDFLRQRNLNANLAAGDTSILVSNANVDYIMENPPYLGITTATVFDGFTLSNEIRTSTGSLNGKGAMFNYRASPTISNCIIKNNKSFNGALVTQDDASPVIKHCTFINNTGQFGSALTNYDGTKPIIDSCNFISNVATAIGGAIYNASSSAIIRNSSFVNNMTTSDASVGHGGAIANSFSTPIIDNCVFIGNKAGSLGGGGAIHNAAVPLVLITNCTFNNNSTERGSGGAVLSTKGYTNIEFKVVIDKCSFSENVAKGVFNGSYLDGGYGGAVCNMEVIDTIRNSTFLNNKATYGGGAVSDYYGPERSTFINTIFYNNETFDAVNNFATGGGYQNNVGGIANIINCVFANNKASSNNDGGGAVMNYGGVINCVNTTFSNNTSASAFVGSNTISIPYGGTVNLSNSIVYGNEAKHIYINEDPSYYGASVINYTNSLVKGVSATTSNLNTNPFFVDAANPSGADGIWGTADDGLILNASSPCINAGKIDTAGLNLPILDIAGNSRIYSSGIVDMGAYEHSAPPVVLGVSLADFTAKAQLNWIKLDWQTMAEVNNSIFIVYRSGNDGHFSKIATVNGAGQSTALKSYVYYDKNPLNGDNYYKLVQIDFDGRETDLGTKPVKFGIKEFAFSAYPNPTDDVLNISIDGGKYTALTIFDLNGKVMHTTKINANEGDVKVYLKHYPSGIYLLKLIGNGDVVTQKIMKK